MSCASIIFVVNRNNLFKFKEMKKDEGKMPKNKLKIDLEQLVFKMIEELPERSKDIIVKRFNFDGNKEAKTLEKIGKEYKITRERVRQIEFEAISRLKNIGEKHRTKEVFQSIEDGLSARGGFAGERKIASYLFGENNNEMSKQVTLFILSLDDRIKETGETRIHRKIYFYEKASVEKFRKVIEKIEKHLEKNKKDVDFDEMLEVANKHFGNKEEFSSLHLKSYLDENKIILRNILGRWGDVKWPGINPRNVKDKAYLTLKKNEKPLHFVEITGKINELWRDGKIANNQTVHNELIKDARFVLIGRGIYALKEWGYSAGTVLDVIIKILEDGGEMKQSDIVQNVFRKRRVKKNTVVLNLQNRKYFRKMSNKIYGLK